MFKYLLYQIEYRRWFFFATLLALIIHFLPASGSLSAQGKSVLAIVAMTMILVIFEPVALPVISFVILVLEILFGLGSPAQVVQSFMSDSVVFIAGSLMLAVAMVKQQLDKRMLFFIVRLTGSSVHLTIFGVVVLTGLMASVMGEHSVAAIMLPVAMILVRIWRENHGEDGGVHSVFLVSVAFGAAVAAIGTPSAGARNAIMLKYWDQLSGLQLGYLEWVVVMYPLVLVQLPLLYLVLARIYQPGSAGLFNFASFVRREVGERRRFSVEDWITVGIMVITVVLWMTVSKSIGLGPVALIGVLLCILTGVLNWEDVTQDVNWGVPILYASVISLGLWMDSTGAAAWLAEGFQAALNWLEIGQGLPFIFLLVLISMLTGAILSSGPAIALLGPVFLHQAQASGANPLVLGMILVAGASYANFTPVSSPACTIVYGSGMVRRDEYFRVGLRLAAVSLVVIVVFARFYWPFVARWL